MRKPTCKKCGGEHYNTQRCDGTNVRQRPVDPTEHQPPVHWGESMRGFRPFGNLAMEGMEHLGNSANTVMRRKQVG